jgi:aspartate-semialdehyde dehydrogenase
MAYKYPIHRNAIPQCDVFEENGYTKEEMKLVRETQKILDDKTIAVTALRSDATYREVTAKR